MIRVGIGPLAALASVGSRFSTLASDEWAVGETMTTWSGLGVRFISKTEPDGSWRYRHGASEFGSWRYRYEFEVIATLK